MPKKEVIVMRGTSCKWHGAACTRSPSRQCLRALISPGYETPPFGDRMLPMRGHRGQNTISKLNPARARTYCMHHDGQPALTDTDARMLALSQVRPAPPPPTF